MGAKFSSLVLGWDIEVQDQEIVQSRKDGHKNARSNKIQSIDWISLTRKKADKSIEEYCLLFRTNKRNGGGSSNLITFYFWIAHWRYMNLEGLQINMCTSLSYQITCTHMSNIHNYIWIISDRYMAWRGHEYRIYIEILKVSTKV